MVYQCIADSAFDSIHITLISALVQVHHDGKVWNLLFKVLVKQCRHKKIDTGSVGFGKLNIGYFIDRINCKTLNFRERLCV